MSVAVNSLLGALNNEGSWKRKASDDEDERQDGNIKKAKYSWYVTLEKNESPIQTDDDTESIYTVQGNETEYARDTSDTSTHSWVSSSESDVSVYMEYELDSRSENENPFMEMTSSSEPESIVEVNFITVCDSEGLADVSDSEGLKNDSDSSSSCDSDMKKADFRICVQCNNPNQNPMFRYCEKCYQMKKTSFPRSRPKRKRRIQKNSSNLQELSEMDSGLVSSQRDSGLASSQDFSDFQNSDLPVFTDSQCNESIVTFGSQNSETISVTDDSQGDSDEHPYSSGSSINGLSGNTRKDPKAILLKNLQSRQGNNDPSTEATESLCIICIKKPKNGVFVHGRTTHRCCCYKCAKKVWITNDHRCPICNQKATQVSKDFCI